MFNFFFFNRAVRMIMWKNTVEPDRPEIRIWRMHIACWITKAANSQNRSLCTTNCSYTTAVFERTHLRVTFTRTLPVLFFLYSFIAVLTPLLPTYISHHTNNPIL